MRRLSKAATTLVLIGSLAAAGCQQTIPKDALQLSEVTIEKRQRQTRYFETTNEKQILGASAAVLQDLGFNIDESETDLGVVVGSKDRDATEAGQIAGAVFVALLFGVVPAVDSNQKIRVSLVTNPSQTNRDRLAVRVTFQRVVWNNHGQISKTEPLDDPTLYQEFFDKLSQSVFLDAHQI